MKNNRKNRKLAEIRERNVIRSGTTFALYSELIKLRKLRNAPRFRQHVIAHNAKLEVFKQNIEKAMNEHILSYCNNFIE